MMENNLHQFEKADEYYHKKSMSDTEANRVSLGDFADDSDLDEQDNDSLDGGISKYEDACHGLMIGTSSIVLKSLRTNSVILSNYGLNSVRVLALCNALKQNITVNKLDLSGNEIGTIGVKHLSNLLQDNSSITILNISKNFIGSGGVNYICEIFKKNRALREVDLSSNYFNDDDGAILIESLDDNLMTKLDLSHNKLAEKSGLAIGKWIAENGNLLDLNLGWNHIRKHAALAVSKGIWDNNKLIKINLSWNGFGNEGANALGKALAHNVMLEELDVRSNRIDAHGFLNLCSCFKENTTLKRLHIGRNIINNESVEAVLTMIKSLSNPLSLELLDISEVSLKPSIEEHISSVAEVHPDFKCLYGFLNFGEKKIHIPSEDALSVIQLYCSKNNITLIDLFSKLDKDGSMSLTYDEFREGLKETGIELSTEKTDALLSFLDRDGDGEIDFRELFAGGERYSIFETKNANFSTKDSLN